MQTNDVITLSSDEEQTPPPKKLKLVTLSAVPDSTTSKTESVIKSEPESCIILLDNDVAQTKERTEHRENENDEEPTSSTTTIIKNGINEQDHTVITTLFNDFLNKCLENISVAEHRKLANGKMIFMRDAFDKYLHLADDYTMFQHSLENNLENLASKPNRALVSFSDIYQLLQTNLCNLNAKETITGKEKIIKKLERFLSKLKRRIDELEEAECNFEEDDNSAYIQVSRYKQRAAEVHAKLCKYRKVNPYSGRITHQRLNFKESEHPEINEAINKKYKNNTVFPTYHEIEKLIRDCVSKSIYVVMNDIDIKIEAKKCFEKLGNYIQQQRKLELYSLHSDYLIDTLDDPAKDDPGLQGSLLNNYKKKMEEETKIFEKFSAMQEKGVKCNESEDASVDDSSDNDENDGNEANDSKNVESKSVECITID